MSEPDRSTPALNRPSPTRATACWLAIDLGAESGRAIAGRFNGDRLDLTEVHRFRNRPVERPGGLAWDAAMLSRETIASLRAGLVTGPIESAGIDGWAVDVGLLRADGALLADPLHYRNPRFGPMVAELGRRISPADAYRRTGIQSLPINTSCQLLALAGSPELADADRLLLIPDLLRFWLTGEATAELTNASTTQLLSAVDGQWDPAMVAAVGITPSLLPPLVPPGTRTGPVHGAAATDLGASVPIVAVASHDTASAVAAVPTRTDTFGYISSGTWSLVGIERDQPTVNDPARLANLTNERGIAGTFRLLKNVMGLWLLQGCRETWRRQGTNLTYDQLHELAHDAPSFGPLIDPDDARLLAPGDMPARIRAICAETGQTPPDSIGAMTRCILESLACAYRSAFEAISRASGQPVTEIHVVGGGARNALLCQLTADATGLPVLGGPVEATAIGNLLVQAMASGRIGSLRELRAVVARSFPVQRYDPNDDPVQRERWRETLERYDALTSQADDATPRGPHMIDEDAAR